MIKLSLEAFKPLLTWYAKHHRDLPWRHTQDTYHIWVSEIMLQQTQVKTVLPRYGAWFRQFPNIESLAKTSLDNVLKAWEGLGYYRRARFLHAAAQQISDKHHGIFPEHFDDMIKLPGIGRSTAGAISSFCFDTPTPVLDGNVKRVLKRWHQVPDANDKQLWLKAQAAIEASNSYALWNQAMMELGATLCTSRKPLCAQCPVVHACLSAFQVQDTPIIKKTAVQDVYWQVQIHQDIEKGIWLTQRPDKGIWAGLWTPPITELSHNPEEQPCHIHLLTHRRLHLYANLSSAIPNLDGQWFQHLNDIALPTGIHQLLKKHQYANLEAQHV